MDGCLSAQTPSPTVLRGDYSVSTAESVSPTDWLVLSASLAGRGRDRQEVMSAMG